MLDKWIIIGNKILESKAFDDYIPWYEVLLNMNICSVSSPSLCWLLPMHGSFAVMSSNFKCWNSSLGYILLLQQWVCCWYFGRKIYTEYHFFLMKAVLTLASLGHYTLMRGYTQVWFLKVRTQFGFRESAAYNEYKRSFVLTYCCFA